MTGRKCQLSSGSKSPFLVYNGVFIRKSTALYLLQENPQLSNDRLLRVRGQDAGHLFSNSSEEHTNDSCVSVGDMSVFANEEGKYVFGRIVQFSYLRGTKREQQYSASYCDVSLPSKTFIGAFAYWVFPFNSTAVDSNISFIPADRYFSAGYISMESFRLKVPSQVITEPRNDREAFYVEIAELESFLPDWKSQLHFEQ